MAAAVAAMLCSPAHALTLGRLTVQSALGEPLRAEIDVPDISAEEAATLQTSIAPPEAFRAAGLEYSAALQGVRLVPQRRADGRMVLRLSSDGPVNEPFVDLILQVNWASGRIVRDYTVLLDPPAQRQPPPAAGVAPQLSPAPASEPAATAPPAAAAPAPVAPSAAPTTRGAGSTTPAPTPPSPAAAASATPRTPAPPATGAGQIVVKPGDTAGRIAAANKPASVSLDQMLVAMLRNNPQAFLRGNVNRVRAGAVLDMPNAEQAGSIPAAEAARTINTQSRDFNAYRSRLAASTPAVPRDGAERSASGRVEGQVDDSRPANTASDKLTLSKGGLQSRAADERIARDKAAKEATERVAELSRNISELNQLGGASGPQAAPVAPSASTASAPAAPESPATAPASAVQPAPETKAASPAVSAPSPSPSPSPAPSAAPAAAPEPERSGWWDGLLANPLMPGLAAALVVLLAGLGVYRARQRKKAEADALDSAKPAESFFGGTGGRRVDTSADDVPASSMAYSPSQLDAGSEVDPVAEADVYLAYGRDLQAEEILKEALRTHPTRLAIHSKLAEIHAKRRDIPAFEALAEQARAVSAGEGPEWARIAELGRTLAPEHRLWANAPATAGSAAAAGAGLLAAGTAAASLAGRDDEHLGPATEPYLPPASGLDDHGAALPASGLDFDLDLDLDPTTPPGTPHQPTADNAPDFSLELPPELPEKAASTEPVPPPPLADDLHFDLDPEPVVAAAPATAEAAAGSPAAALPIDLGSLSLDLGDTPAAEPAAAPAELPGIDDPLATKLALAEEFNAIGDSDGARALAEEVLAEATGPLKSQAERFLADLA